MTPITFSTLACPQWSVETVIRKAAEFGYDGLEWRGGTDGHVRPDMSATQKYLLRSLSEDSGLMALAVTSYTSFVSDQVGEQQANIDDLKRYIDLAAELGATYVRAFLGELQIGMKINDSLYERVVSCLMQVVEHAIRNEVQIAVEPHDNFALSSAIYPVLKQTLPEIRVIWDVGNAFAAGEEPQAGFDLLKDRLAYVQVKDGLRTDTDWQLTPLGQGNLPLEQAFDLLQSFGYTGSFSVEWEYAWHPELDPPEIALPASIQYIKKLLAEVQSN